MAVSAQNPLLRSRTKIVATVGPACDTAEGLAALVEAGVDVFRLNMAHGSTDAQQARVQKIRALSAQLQLPLGVLVDLGGPKIRLGQLPGDQVEFQPDSPVRFVRGDKISSPEELVTTYPPLVDELSPGDRVVLADGAVILVVETKSGDSATCRVVQGGKVRSRQGVNLPGVKLSVPALTSADWQHVEWAAIAGVDFLGLSFVRKADDVRQLKEFLGARGAKTHVIAKIEKPEALEDLQNIVAASDGVMVARGDLGVEIDVAHVALVQKQIVAVCRRAQKPVIVATQMLESMQHSRYPTRAEATDVANAALDGADACMLSGETAVGQYPRETVEMMHRILTATESEIRDLPSTGALAPIAGLHEITQAVVHGADRIARDLGAKLVVVASHSGATVRAMSHCRLPLPLLGVSDQPSVLQQMSLLWGVVPLEGAPTKDAGHLVQFITQWGRTHGALQPGDRIVVVRGTKLADVVHNLLVVQQV